MKHLLFCTDSSHYAMEGSKYLAWLLERTQAKATALYVSDIRRFQTPALVDLSGSLGVQPYRDMLSQLREAEKEKAKYLEESLQAFAREKGFADRLHFETRTGLLVDTIGDFEDSAELIILGKRGEGCEFASEHLGSTLERVVRVSRKPCLVTNRKYRQIRKLAIAYDGGKSCRDALTYLQSADWLKEFPIDILTVTENESEDWAAAQLKEAEASLTGAGWTVRAEMLNGVAEDSIARYVETTEIDLLIMGAYGHSRIRRFLIGSTSTELLRRCRIPMLCFH